MKCYLDENQNVLSLLDLKNEYNDMIANGTIEKDAYANCQAWIYDCVHYAGTLTEVNLSDKFRLHEDSDMEINLLYVDKKELPSVLTALIKQNLYRWNNEKQEDGCSIEAAKEHVEAEIAKTERLTKSLYSLLSILKSLFEVKYESSKAYHVAIDCDVESDLLGQIGTIDDNMEEEIASVISSIGKMLELIVPEFKSDSLICEEWFFEDSEYIDTLMYWCKNLNIEML